MNLDEALAQVQTMIADVCPDAVIQVKTMSDEEARMSVYAAEAQMERIREATREITIQLMTREGLDVQVFVYDRAATPPPA